MHMEIIWEEQLNNRREHNMSLRDVRWLHGRLPSGGVDAQLTMSLPVDRRSDEVVDDEAYLSRCHLS
jgi:hypothetical protein